MARRKLELEDGVLDAAYYLLKNHKELWLDYKHREEHWANKAGPWRHQRKTKIEKFLKTYEANELLEWPKNK